MYYAFTLQYKALYKMTEREEHLKQISDIRNMMERSSRFISLSGLSGVFAGIFALAGAAAFYAYVNGDIHYGLGKGIAYYTQSLPVFLDNSFLIFCIADAAIVLLLSLAAGIFFTTRNAKSKGQKIWDLTARKMLFHLAVPLVAGGIFCLVLMRYGLFGLVAPATLIFFGLSLLNASKFTLDEIQYLGYSEIVLGLIGCLFIGYGITLWAIGFGVLLIIYGLVMYIRYEAQPKEKKFW
jgi:hypothetical protein